MKISKRVPDRKMFEQLLTDGHTTAVAADQSGVASSTAYKWARAGQQAGASSSRPPQFARLVPQSQVAPRIEIEVSGVTIRVAADIDSKALARLIAIVKGLP